MKRVVVGNKYTYETELPVEIGQKVRLPGRGSGHFDAEVTALESTYDGPCKQIMGIVKTYIGTIEETSTGWKLSIQDGKGGWLGTAVGITRPDAILEAKKMLKKHDPLGELEYT